MKNGLLILRFDSISRIQVWLVTALYSLLMLILSVPLDFVSYRKEEAGKLIFERGYFSAINWSVGFTLFVPLFFYYGLGAFKTANRFGSNLFEKGMLVNINFRSEPDAEKHFNDTWKSILIANERWAIFLLCCGLMFTSYEWWTSSYGPLMCGSVIPEVDWSVKALDTSSNVNPLVNAAFSFFVFSMQAAFIGGLAYFISLIISVVTLLSPEERKSVRIIPNLNTDDSRLGFQVFENLAVNILWTSAFGYAIFYLSRLWNAYLHADQPYSSLYDFVIGSILTGFSKNVSFQKIVSQAGDTLFEIGTFSSSGILVISAALVIFSLSVIIVLVALRGLASQSKDELLTFLESKDESFLFSGIPKKKCIAKLKAMEMWPISYPKPTELLLMATFALISLIFFRMGLLYIGTLIYMITSTVFKKLNSIK